MSLCKTKKCGCEDKGLTTPTPCEHDTIDCPTPEPCPETFSDCCVIHNGDSIVDLNILEGDRICDILQKLTLYITNPTCADPNGACPSVIGLKSLEITTTTIKVGWYPTPNATTYQVEYRNVNSLVWLVNPAVVQSLNPVDTIGLLTPGDSYYIRVRTICGVGPSDCRSVTILVKTKTL